MTGPDTEQPDATSVLLPGPWAHRDVSANGVRLHAAEAGDGPLVLLLHGFPQFWWAWRSQLTGLAAAGLRVVAPDLRGYGASDKPPRGYDLPTAAADAAAVIRALGETDAVVVGSDWGGLVGWTMAALHPRSVRRLVVLGAAHPRRLPRPSVTDAQQRRALAVRVRRSSCPGCPSGGSPGPTTTRSPHLMRRWAGPAWINTSDFAEAVSRYRSASRIPQAAYGAMEYYRWAGRSQLRPDGLRFARRMAAPITAPTLQLHGALDRYVLPAHRPRLRPLRGRRLRVAGAARRRATSRTRRPPTRSPPPSPPGPGTERPPGQGSGLTRRGRCRRRRAPSGPAVAASDTSVGGQRVAGVRLVDGGGEDHAEHAAVGREQRAAGVAGPDLPEQRVDVALDGVAWSGSPGR